MCLNTFLGILSSSLFSYFTTQNDFKLGCRRLRKDIRVKNASIVAPDIFTDPSHEKLIQQVRKNHSFHLESSLFAALCPIQIMFCSATGAVKSSLPPAALKSFLPSICSQTYFPSFISAFWCRTDRPIRGNFHTDYKMGDAG